MRTPVNSPTMMVPLRESTVVLLMKRRLYPEDTLDRVVERLAADPVPPRTRPVSPTARRERRSPISWADRYEVAILGEVLTAPTLAQLFAAAVDLLAALDPAVIVRLATMCARKRRYVARFEAEVHPGRPDLGVLQTASGWWVSANVGQADVRRALKALCDAAGLTFGKDVVFPLPPSQDAGLRV